MALVYLLISLCETFAHLNIFLRSLKASIVIKREGGEVGDGGGGGDDLSSVTRHIETYMHTYILIVCTYTYYTLVVDMTS